jgi:hypothetical protein
LLELSRSSSLFLTPSTSSTRKRMLPTRND